MFVEKKYGVVQATAATLLSGSPAVLLSTTKSRTNPSTLSLSHPLVLERGSVGGMRSGFVRYEDEDDDDFSSNDDGGSDSDQTAGLVVGAGGGAGVVGVGGVVGSGVDRRTGRMNKALLQNRGKILPSNARQRNLKQKFVALLKRFKITEDLQGLENEADEDPTKLTGNFPVRYLNYKVFFILKSFAGADLEMDAGDIEDLIDELEDLSDSGPEMDTLSVTSTPKPSLRPFFASSRSLLAPDLNSNPSAFTFPTTGTFFSEKAAATITSSGLSGGGRRLERHYSDESSKRADSDSTHAESMWTDQDRESDTPTAPSAHCPSHLASATNDDKTKVNSFVFYFSRWGLPFIPQTSNVQSSGTLWTSTNCVIYKIEWKRGEKKSIVQPGAIWSFVVVHIIRELRSFALLRDLQLATTDATKRRHQKGFQCPRRQH